MATLSLALFQQPPVFLNTAASLARAIELVREASRDGADIAVFPETWLPGYPVWLDEAPGAALWDHPPAGALFRHLFAQAIEIDGQEAATLHALAVELAIDIVIGVHERFGASLYNSVLRFGGDGVIQVHRKIMPTYGERLIWASADGSTLAGWPTPHGPMGALICWEHWMPLARAAQHAQGEVLHFALWPGLGDIHHVASRHYAFEGQCFVAAAGCYLTRDDVLDGFDSCSNDATARELLAAIPPERRLLKAGGSAVFGPDGGFVAGPAEGPVTLHATIDLDRVVEGRLRLDTNGHYSRPDIFELRVDRRPRPGVTFDDPPGLHPHVKPR